MVFTSLISLAVFASPAAGAAPGGAVGFVREDARWVAAEPLCIVHPHDGLGYLLKPAQPDGPTELHEQAGRDGRVTRRLALGAARSTDPGSGLHGSDCGMGSCWDDYERPVEGTSSTLQFRGIKSNYLQESLFRWRVSGAAADGPVRHECFGGRLLLACVSPRWEVMVELMGDPNGAQPLSIHYRARHLEGKPEELELGGGKLAIDGPTTRAVFTNKGFAYTLSASADASAPSANLRVVNGQKAVVEVPCTAYFIDPEAVQSAKVPARGGG